MNKQKAAAMLAAFCLLLALGVPALALDADRLVPVGSAVGIRLDADGVLVVGLADVKTSSGTLRPAEDAGLRVGDLVTRVGERKTDSAAAFLTAVSELDGQPVTLTAERDGETVELTVTPAQTVNGAWQLGLWLRDGVSGIGTVTFYDPVSGTFGALGHGVNDLDTGALLPFGKGAITGARVVDVVPGAAGKPGELCGEFDADAEKGVLRQNTTSGIFGVADWQDCGESLPVASEDETELGPASILCCVTGDEVREYSVEISRIYRSPEDHRFLMLTVTDEALLETTGGIVQGMSGSPIIQNGKLIGAVTHVLINDATRGYGISIRDMLAAA